MILGKMKKIAIIGNGVVNNIEFHKNLLEEIEIILCADGGASNAKKIGVIPTHIIGDLDSTTKELIDFFKSKKTKIIQDKNQDKTDMELAIELAESLKPDEIIILGAIGYRIDHTLANILCLNKINKNINARIIDDRNIIELIDNSKDILGKKDEIISIIPLTDVIDLSYKGMKWLISNKNTKLGWFGISNKLTEIKAKISLKKGKILIIRVRD
jgi:thiamine pyrophosphokinase